MISKVISILISYFVGKLTSGHRDAGVFANIPMGAVKRVLALATAAAVAVFLMVGGFFTVLVDLVLATRAQGALALTQASIVGFALVGLSALSLIFFVFKESAWKLELESPKEAPSPLAEALADLVRDFTEERRLHHEYGAPQATTRDDAAAASAAQYRPTPPLHM